MNHLRLLTLYCLLLLQACSNNTPEANKTQQSPTLVKDTSNSITHQRCSEVIMQILTSSDRYKELTKGLGDAVAKNGGSSYGINFEGSPNPQEDSALDYSETYDFSLHETYPDHNAVIARFSFDKSKMQLYEYNVAADSLIPIAFNQQLVNSLNSSCK